MIPMALSHEYNAHPYMWCMQETVDPKITSEFPKLLITHYPLPITKLPITNKILVSEN